jgi:pantoate--beta-alanine ligase
MEILRSAAVMQAWAVQARRNGLRIGFVPTMGALHEGHLSLVRLARSESDRVVLSIFVNPLQFGPAEDLARYPRDFARDETLCRGAGVDVVFYPAVEDMYAPDHSVYVEETALSRGLCGAARPGHFRGVATVVAKLFNLVLPDVAVFGQKDAQQLAVIRRLVRDLHFPVRIVAGPIWREPDGLAMSSRNRYLNPRERQEALCLRRALDLAERLHREGLCDAGALREALAADIRRTPSAVVDYVEVVDNRTLEPVTRLEGEVLVALAVKIGATRLIDNTVLPTAGSSAPRR